jgi:hypothetical protein
MGKGQQVTGKGQARGMQGTGKRLAKDRQWSRQGRRTGKGTGKGKARYEQGKGDGGEWDKRGT